MTEADKTIQPGAEGAGVQQPPASGATGATGAPPLKEVPASQKVAKPEGAEPKRVRLKGGDEDIPDDADLIEMTPRAFASRVGRMTKKELKEIFGTDDVDQIKKDQAELTQLRADKEKSRLDGLSKEQKLEEEKRKEATRAERAEAALKREREDRTYEKQDNHMSRLAAKLIDEDHVDVELKKFARHLIDTYKPKQLERLRGKALDEVFEAWAKERIAEKPKIGKGYGDALREELKAELRGEKPKAKVTNGANGGHPDAKVKNGNAGPVIPGKLSPEEYKKWKRSQGYNY